MSAPPSILVVGMSCEADVDVDVDLESPSCRSLRPKSAGLVSHTGCHGVLLFAGMILVFMLLAKLFFGEMPGHDQSVVDPDTTTSGPSEDHDDDDDIEEPADPMRNRRPFSTKPPTTTECGEFRVAFIGSSYTYRNDLVHLVQHFLNEVYIDGAVQVKACLFGGAAINRYVGYCRMTDSWEISGRDWVFSLQELLLDSCGWDVVVIQDNSQAPAYEPARKIMEESLANDYVPLLRQNAGSKKLLTLFYETWGDRADHEEKIFKRWYCPNHTDCPRDRPRKSEILGDFWEYTKRLETGYNRYKEVIQNASLESAVVPSAGLVARLRDTHPKLLFKTYSADRTHLAGEGVFAVASLIAKTIIEYPRYSHLFRGSQFEVKWPIEVMVRPEEEVPTRASLTAMMQAAGFL